MIEFRVLRKKRRQGIVNYVVAGGLVSSDLIDFSKVFECPVSSKVAVRESFPQLRSKKTVKKAKNNNFDSGVVWYFNIYRDSIKHVHCRNSHFVGNFNKIDIEG